MWTLWIPASYTLCQEIQSLAFVIFLFILLKGKRTVVAFVSRDLPPLLAVDPYASALHCFWWVSHACTGIVTGYSGTARKMDRPQVPSVCRKPTTTENGPPPCDVEDFRGAH